MSEELIPTLDFCGEPLRVYGTPNAPLFLAGDVCRVLDIHNSRDAVEKLDDDEKAVVALTDTGLTGVTQRRNVTAVTESGLYTLILRCRDAVIHGTRPHRFRKYVTSVVMPMIRKTGAYSVDSVPALPQNYLEALRALTVEVEAKERLALENVKLADSNAIMVPKAEFFDCAMTSKQTLLVRDAAKLLNPDIPGGMGEKRLFAWMRANGWLFGDNRIYQTKIDAGYMVATERPIPTGTHGTLIKLTPRFTQIGLVAIRKAILKGCE